MKGLKIFGFIVGGLLILAALVFAVALMPSVQTWAVRKAMADQPGMTFEVTRVAAGMSSAEISNLKLVKDGVVVTAKSVTAKYSAWDYLTKDKINADVVNVTDLVVDLRNAASATSNAGTKAGAASAKSPPTKSPAPRVDRAPSSDPAAPFSGYLDAAQLPFDVRLAQLTATGRALLPNNQLVTFDLKGARIETGQSGKLEWTIDFADSTANAALRALRATGHATIRIAADRRIDSIEVETSGAAMGPNLPADPVRLSARAEKPAPKGDETYTVSINLVKGGATDPIVKADARYTAARRDITGTWTVALRREQLAGLLAGFGLPELSANGSGKFGLKPDTHAISASGNLQAQTTELQKILPQLQAIGTVQLKTTFDGSMADNIARLDALNLEVSGADGRKFAQVNSLQKVSYSLNDQRVTLADPKSELARVSLQALPLAWAQPFVKPQVIESGDISLALAVEAELDGSRIRTRALEPLTLRNVTIRDRDTKLVDRLTATVRPSIDYSADKIVAQLGELNVTTTTGDTLTGKLSADITNTKSTPIIAFAAQLQGKIVGALKPFLPVETGPLAVTAAIEGRHEGDVLQLAKISTSVNRDGGALLTAFDLRQPLRANLKDSTLAVSSPTEPAARVRLGDVPLAWIEPFVEKSKLSGALAGGTIDLTLRTVEDLTIATTEPVTLRAVTATLDGKPLVQSLDVAANFSATKRGNTIGYELRSVEAKQGQTTLAALELNGDATLGGKRAITAKGKLDVDAALLNQPALAAYATLSRGRIAANFDANVSESIQARAAVSAKNLVAKQDNRVLGDLELTLNATMKSDGSGNVAIPLTLTNANRKSDVTIDGTFGKAAKTDTFLFTGKVASNQLVADDFQALAVLAPSAEKPAATSTPPPRPSTPPRSTPSVASTPSTAPTRDTAPFWKGVNGKFDLDLKRVLYGKDYDGSVRGAAVITDTRLALESLEGNFKDKPFTLSAGLTFAPPQPKPYTLAGNIDINGLALGPILQAANPNEKPQLETTVRVVGKFNGTGLNLGDLPNTTTGQFNVTGGSGTLRIIGGKTGGAVGIVSGLGMLGGVLGGSNSTVAAATLLREMVEMPFEQFAMTVERGTDLNLKLTSIEFLSPSTRITGTGIVTHQPDTPLVRQPIQLELRIAGKQHMHRMLDEARVLGDQVDEKGYGVMRAPFRVQGTVAQMQDNFWTVLLDTALQMRSDLRGR